MALGPEMFAQVRLAIWKMRVTTLSFRKSSLKQQRVAAWETVFITLLLRDAILGNCEK